MSNDLIHRIGIATPAETIYRAITTEEGIRAWWTTDVKMDASVVAACRQTAALPKKTKNAALCRGAATPD